MKKSSKKEINDMHIKQRSCKSMKEALNLTLTWEKLRLISDIFGFNVLVFLHDMEELKRYMNKRRRTIK